MSGHDLWIVVEGRDHDRTHYEKLLDAIPSTRDRTVSIRLAEQIKLGDVSAGGKEHALAIHDHLAETGKLITQTSAGRSAIAFMIDRDRDDFLGTLRTSNHIVYTFGSDVEADILLHADIWAALRSAYGVDSSLSDRVRQKAPDPASSLLLLWHDWLNLTLTAIACGTPGQAPWSTLSKINENHFGTIDATQADEVRQKIETSVGVAVFTQGKSRALSHFRRRGVRLLKGRWVARYIKHLVEVHLADEVVRVKVQPDAVIDTALMTLSYEGRWAEEYDAQFAKVLSPGT